MMVGVRWWKQKEGKRCLNSLKNEIEVNCPIGGWSVTIHTFLRHGVRSGFVERSPISRKDKSVSNMPDWLKLCIFF